MWDRLAPPSRRVMDQALAEAERVGAPYLGAEHLLLGLAGLESDPAARLLATHGLDVDTLRSAIGRLRPDWMKNGVLGDAALRGTLGVDVERLRRQLVATFGVEAVERAACRVSRRPWWRGGPRQSPLSGRPVLIKRALEQARILAGHLGEPLIHPEQLLYGVLLDLRAPLGSRLSRRSRRDLARLGLDVDAENPAHTALQALGVDSEQLRAELCADRRWPV